MIWDRQYIVRSFVFYAHATEIAEFAGALHRARGAVIGAVGGLIGLGGTEFRLPLLIGAFQFAAL